MRRDAEALLLGARASKEEQERTLAEAKTILAKSKAELAAIEDRAKSSKSALAEAETILAKSKANLDGVKESANGRKIPWGFIILIAVLLVAFFTNPDQASLEKTCRESMQEYRANAGMLEILAGDVLLDVSYERKNYYLFSIGTVKSRLRLGGPESNIEILGAFGYWWFELLDTPLYETTTK